MFLKYLAAWIPLMIPERELRHIAHLGDEVLIPSIQKYEEITGERIDDDLVLFWAKLQATVNSIFRKARNLERSDEPLKIAFLQKQYPQFDWQKVYPNMNFS